MTDLASLLTTLVQRKHDFVHTVHGQGEQYGVTVRSNGVRFEFNALGELVHFEADMEN